MEEELVVAYTVKNAATAEIIKNALEAEGIACALGNERQAGLTGIFDIDVLVRAEDAERARELIDAARLSEDTEEADEGEEEPDVV